VICTDAAGHTTTLEMREGWSVMQMALNKGLEGIEAICGGMLACRSGVDQPPASAVRGRIADA